MLEYQGTGYPNGFNPNTEKPLDVRLVVATLLDRNLIQFTYPSMPVTVLGAPVVVAGVETFPNMTHWRCLVRKSATFGGPTTVNSDWKEQRDAVLQGSYKGAWNAATNTPSLYDAALIASLVAGDYFKVSVPGNSNIDGYNSWGIGDTVIWTGTDYDRIESTSEAPVAPLYDITEGTRFQADVLAYIRLNALKEHVPGTAYGLNTFVKSTYQEDGKDYVDTYVALNAMAAPAAGLPTSATPNANWQLITTTNGRKLGGTMTQDDTLGRAATGEFTPTTRTPGKTLSIEEFDARLKQYGGALSGPILGGDAATFITANPAEAPRN